MRYAIILTIAVLAMGYVPSLTGQTIDRLGALPPGPDQHSRPDLHPAEVDLFERRDETLTATQQAVKKAAPLIQKAEGIVLIFGADWCTWCKRQAGHLKPHSNTHNMVILKIDEPGVGRQVGLALDVVDKNGDPKNGLPVTIVLEKGEPVETFFGFTPWDNIRPHAKKARKSDDDQKGFINIGPLRIDWDLDGYDPDDTYDRQRRRY